MKKIKVAISACLLGQEVRYNGGHKHAPFCTQVLSKWFEYLPICPEVEIGMGVPREPIRLVMEGDQVRSKNVGDHSQDYTDQLTDYAHQKLPELADVCGYIFMQKSPSCGLFRVKAYLPTGMPHNEPQTGIYAKVIDDELPLLPKEEAGRLNDVHLRENFIIRVFATDAWRREVLSDNAPGALVEFHRRYKFLLQAHSEVMYRELGRLVARANEGESIRRDYFQLFMQCLAKPAKIKSHVNVLYHLLGFFKNSLSTEAKASIIKTIEQYQQQKVFLMTPLTMMRHYAEVHHINYLLEQVYLQPYPNELGLQNHI
ncbi:DUF523 and DUF1722 domain-containing protein [Marinicella gelatinilytica]|uniref:DUF523 and DUF1722 domain-containing protein n=1 Tax=Marinicella gelatinilytica TaxID=2996017 RepID=UPI002260DB93|nr:DUF523 and DUF1722 domain-containing protein [Marinicella gelatinilytica]MCX7545185.1 DUF523 and DUF1722 domain-containing protein [Marinicella gelatinilytica]